MLRFDPVARLAFLLLCLVPVAGPAVIIEVLTDSLDDLKVVQKAQVTPKVVALGSEVEAVRRRMLGWKERDFHALFGKPVDARKARYALMCPEPRIIARSGRRYADPKLNKDHIDTHLIGPGRIDVYYQLDGVTPSHVHFYLKTDADFLKLDRLGNLDKRLAWERAKFLAMAKRIEQRRREVFVWEIDVVRQRKKYQGMDSGNFDAKLDAMLRWGEKQGYRLEHRPAMNEATPRWEWHHRGRLVAEAYHDRGFKGQAGKPSYFILYRPDGTRLRDDTGWPSLAMIRWYRPDGTMVRSESGKTHEGNWRPTGWSWYDEKGKGIHTEWDSNGDGIPDAYSPGPAGSRDSGRPLSVEQSWAVHPERIPAAVAIPGQADRRVPLRKIPE